MRDLNVTKEIYSDCKSCGVPLEPVWFREKEITPQTGSRFYYPTETGRTKKSCSHLECPNCLRKECVDDSFDGPWV